MPNQEDIEQQQQLLATHRRTLTHLLKQAAQYGGEAFAPPNVFHGISECRHNIRKIKDILRAWNVGIEDLPDDTEPSINTSTVCHISVIVHEGNDRSLGIEEATVTLALPPDSPLRPERYVGETNRTGNVKFFFLAALEGKQFWLYAS